MNSLIIAANDVKSHVNQAGKRKTKKNFYLSKNTVIFWLPQRKHLGKILLAFSLRPKILAEKMLFVWILLSDVI